MIKVYFTVITQKINKYLKKCCLSKLKKFLKNKFSSLKVVYVGNPEIGHEVFYLLNKKKFKIEAFFTYEVTSN